MVLGQQFEETEELLSEALRLYESDDTNLAANLLQQKHEMLLSLTKKEKQLKEQLKGE